MNAFVEHCCLLHRASSAFVPGEGFPARREIAGIVEDDANDRGAA